jgi:predicted dehydrogenase
VISRKYLGCLGRLPGVSVVACADLVAEKAVEAAALAPGARACSPAEAIRSDDVDLVLNLTIPAAHAAVSQQALAAGKHVYVEKPLAATAADGADLLAMAESAGCRIGCAPDTVLGTGIQTARRLIDDGVIGAPIAATAFMLSRGPDQRHPNPAFFYEPGGGPLYDMGPYYLTALVTLLGPIARVAGMARSPRRERRVAHGPNAGLVIPVAVDTHVCTLIEHESGVISTLVTSFDLAGRTRLPRMEIYGTAGTLAAPNPNLFDGPVEVSLADEDGWRAVEANAGYQDGERGVGVLDLAQAARGGSAHRASGDLALHVLAAMEAITTASRTGASVEVEVKCRRPEAVPLTDPVSAA